MSSLPPLPSSFSEFQSWTWSQIEPYYQELAARDLDASNVDAWLLDWTRLSALVRETHGRLMVATTVNTADEAGAQKYKDFLDTILPPSEAAEQKLKEKILASRLEPEGLQVPLKKMRAQAELFREANLPLLTQEQKLETDYDKVWGARTVMWDGVEIPILQLRAKTQDPDRSIRERAYHLSETRMHQDRPILDPLWTQFLNLRKQIAANADCDSYRTYKWRQLTRFDYTPDDCKQFHDSIEAVVVPAATRLYAQGRRRLGVDVLRPWDLTLLQGFGRVADPPDVPPLRPYTDASALEGGVSRILHRVDPEVGAYFEIMRKEGLLDLFNRKNKAAGGYSTTFPVVRRPFIFMNAIGTHGDVTTLLHESGHAIHSFESRNWPYLQQRRAAMEFNEVASMAMELLGAPYLASSAGGFYAPPDAARAFRGQLEKLIYFWPYMATVDAFQHWVYENVEAAQDPAACDERWLTLWQRFMPGVDYTGETETLRGRWQNQPHIYGVPFYYIEYGVAQLGAVQVWANARRDQAEAIAQYRRALSLGGTATLPELYRAAGVKFTFDAATLRAAVGWIEQALAELDGAG